MSPCPPGRPPARAARPAGVAAGPLTDGGAADRGGPFGDPRSAVPPDRPRDTPAPRAASPAVAALAARLARGADAAPLADFWAGVRAAGTPLRERDPLDPDRVVLTFLWRGEAAEVLVLANKLTDRFDLPASRMHRLAGTDLWHLSYRLPRRWRGSYHLAPRTGAARGFDWVAGSRRPDPLNPHTLPAADGPPASVAEAAPAGADPLWRPRPGVPAGTVTTVEVCSAHLGGARRVWRYRPAAPGPYRLLVLLDGQIWGPLLPVAPILDNLVAAGRIPPTVALLPDSGEGAGRAGDYTCRPAFAEFLARELVPAAAGALPVTADAAHTVIAGQSLGGLAAAHAALRAPHRFGTVLTHSGAYWWPHLDGAAPEWLAGAVSRRDRAPLRWDLGVGADEWISVGPHRRLRDALRARGYPVRYAEWDGGHDRACWREELAAGLVRTLA
ncbi:MAG TPA: enterochelin esterase [Pilimelia sp.]|nr:enterochelin esterase [Pilimelia sp.]